MSLNTRTNFEFFFFFSEISSIATPSTNQIVLSRISFKDISGCFVRKNSRFIANGKKSFFLFFLPNSLSGFLGWERVKNFGSAHSKWHSRPPPPPKKTHFKITVGTQLYTCSIPCCCAIKYNLQYILQVYRQTEKGVSKYSSTHLHAYTHIRIKFLCLFLSFAQPPRYIYVCKIIFFLFTPISLPDLIRMVNSVTGQLTTYRA